MLARRLLLLIAVLLVVGAFASAIAPRDSTNNDRATTPTVTPPAGGAPPQSAGSTISEELPGVTGGKPKIVRAQVGDLIDLTVQAPGPDTVTIEGYDEIQPADPANPAHFSFFADEPGTFAVTLQDAGTVVGRLEIERRA